MLPFHSAAVQRGCYVSIKGLSEAENRKRYFFSVSNAVLVDKSEDRTVVETIYTLHQLPSISSASSRPPNFCDVNCFHLASAWLLQGSSFSIVS